MDKSEWEIIDDNGVIYSGYTEEETRQIFEEVNFDWDGDLKFIEVHAVRR